MKFEFWFEEASTLKATFTADTIEQAREMLKTAIKINGVSDLPDYNSIEKNYEANYEPQTLKEAL